jgi:hypothetical protein
VKIGKRVASMVSHSKFIVGPLRACTRIVGELARSKILNVGFLYASL